MTEQLTEPVPERENLIEYLDHFRGVFERKCEGLDAEQLATRSVPPSTLSLLGLLRHLAFVEQIWFRVRMANQPAELLWGKKDDWDADFDGAEADEAQVDAAWTAWHREVAYARDFVDRAESLEVLSANPDREPISLRNLLVHMIEEYARHCGHADLLRECIDGRTGD